ncbi:hypothetical protein KI387_044662, partial [Taxus chinensis]
MLSSSPAEAGRRLNGNNFLSYKRSHLKVVVELDEKSKRILDARSKLPYSHGFKDVGGLQHLNSAVLFQNDDEITSKKRVEDKTDDISTQPLGHSPG